MFKSAAVAMQFHIGAVCLRTLRPAGLFHRPEPTDDPGWRTCHAYGVSFFHKPEGYKYIIPTGLIWLRPDVPLAISIRRYNDGPDRLPNME